MLRAAREDALPRVTKAFEAWEYGSKSVEESSYARYLKSARGDWTPKGFYAGGRAPGLGLRAWPRCRNLSSFEQGAS